MNFNSAAYRVLTLSAIAGFIFTTIKTTTIQAFSGSDSSVLLYQLGRMVGGALIPGFLLWRNVETFKQRGPIVPLSLIARAPWYYTVAIVGVWLQLVFTFVLPALGVVVGYSTLSYSVAMALFLGNLSATGLWLGQPTVFFMEVICAFHRGGEPNNALHATCEDARA